MKLCARSLGEPAAELMPEEQTRSVCGMRYATKKHTLQERYDTKMVLLHVILLQDMVAVIAVVVDTGRHPGHT